MYKLKFVPVDKNGNIIMPQHELETLVSDAYNSGFEDGKSYVISPNNPQPLKHNWNFGPTTCSALINVEQSGADALNDLGTSITSNTNGTISIEKVKINGKNCINEVTK